MVATATSTSTAAASGSLRRLTPDEQAAYARDGYVAVAGVIPPAELEAIDREIDRLIAVPGRSTA